MKRKHRSIVVDGVKYGWIPNNARYDVYLGKEKIFGGIHYTETPMTPRMIADKIREWNRRHIDPSNPPYTLQSLTKLIDEHWRKLGRTPICSPTSTAKRLLKNGPNTHAAFLEWKKDGETGKIDVCV